MHRRLEGSCGGRGHGGYTAFTLEDVFHFDEIRRCDLDELLTMLIMSLVFFGFPAFMVSAGLGFFCQRLRTWYVMSSLPVLGLLFGLVTGYFAEWADYRWYRFSPERFHWTEPLAVFGSPEDAMANSYGGDWQDARLGTTEGTLQF
jgi:hypothetical protein